ncbi:hypothetical protein [Bacillus sp. MRMR6]|nr:hypothetical protein [Bacillus sp. MRMR6]
MKKAIILLFSLSLLLLLTPAKGGSHDLAANNLANGATPNDFPIYPPVG